MAKTQRAKNVNWVIPDPAEDWSQVQVAILLDLRDELQALNRLLACPNFISIPATLRQIASNTAKPRKKKGSPK